ncbi:HAD superfamily hydrolase (TIGR01549 family) [Streptomyces sp. 840.1]|uniref:HAD family hydrolase n=1 Tax=Streptomyces sp. 840.1 TaxID=2485152 RepID=UPI000F48F550|nr:HAD family hydrolase [Streptomyces sp. 840.1]ROQ67770.1 HAD superfamily hydrolase (TIGR01549 family) [Streptomyces sp. 840.1]
MIETIVLDVGETLIRDDRYWSAWADWLDAPPHTLSALVGAAVVQGRDNADALRLLRPGIDIAAEYAAREAAGCGESLDERDLYADVRPTLAALQGRGIRVIVAGNQTAKAGQLLRAFDLPADLVVMSAEWGVAKPAPEFFARVLAVSGAGPQSTLYVGDHPANDVFPARTAGLLTAHIRRGPWGYWWADDPEVRAAADWSINSLTDLLDVVSP